MSRPTRQIAAAPDLHLAEFRRFRTLLVVDEVHIICQRWPTSIRPQPRRWSRVRRTSRGAWSRALLPLLECAAVRLLLSGTLERADGRGILWLHVSQGTEGPHPGGGARCARLGGGGLLAQAGLDRTSGAARHLRCAGRRGKLARRDGRRARPTPARPRPSGRDNTVRRCSRRSARGFAEALLREAFVAIRDLRARRRQQRGLPPAAAARGLGKLLVVAPDQVAARRYLAIVRGWVPAAQADTVAQIATADAPGAHAILAAFRLRPEPSILVTVAMAYEGLDVPDGGGGGCPDAYPLARLARADGGAGHPGRPACRTLRRPAGAGVSSGRSAVRPVPPAHGDGAGHAGETAEAGPRTGRVAGLVARSAAADEGGHRAAIVERAGAALRDAAAGDPTWRCTGRSSRSRRPSCWSCHRSLSAGCERSTGRDGGGAGRWKTRRRGLAARSGAGPGHYHRYNAALKRVSGNKSRAQMTLAELEAAIGWLERNRLSDHLHLLDDDPRYAWTARRRGEWKPPVGRDPRSPLKVVPRRA